MKKANSLLFMMLFVLISNYTYPKSNIEKTIKVKQIDISIARKLINKGKRNSVTRLIPEDFKPDKQSFKINTESGPYYILSGTSQSKSISHRRCGVVLLSETGKTLNSINAAPIDEDIGWACDGAEAMSFSDYYPDGSLKIIAIYNMTPPSNERFRLPAILKFNFSAATLTIDEKITRKFQNEDIDAETINEVKTYLKKQNG